MGRMTAVGRVYLLAGRRVRLLALATGPGPRNCLIEVIATRQRIVRPFRGLRRP